MRHHSHHQQQQQPQQQQPQHVVLWAQQTDQSLHIYFSPIAGFHSVAADPDSSFIFTSCLRRFHCVWPTCSCPFNITLSLDDMAKEGLILGSKETVYPVLQWVLTNRADLTNRAYLARMLTLPCEIPASMLADPELADLYEEVCVVCVAGVTTLLLIGCGGGGATCAWRLDAWLETRRCCFLDCCAFSGIWLATSLRAHDGQMLS
jgi:hypothetical protein